MSAVVIQADRVAAAAWLRQCPAIAQRVIAGEQDEHGYVRAFATHRTEATAELVEALRETACDMSEAAGKLRQYGAVLSADILTAQAAKTRALISRVTGDAS